MTLDAKTFSELITFTRSTTGTRVNASGLIETVAIDQPRFDFYPVTGQALGILIEESRTNLLKYSEQIDNAAWVKGGTYFVTADYAVAPDGTTTADLFGPTSGNTSFSTDTPTQTVTKSASATTYTYSAFVKPVGTCTAVRLSPYGGSTSNTALVVFDLTTGAVFSSATATGTFTAPSALPAEQYPNGWWRVALTFTTGTETDIRARLFPYAGAAAFSGDGSSGVCVWGAQLEAGGFQTSYMPTTSAQVTRAADTASVSTANIPGYIGSVGTLFADLQYGNLPFAAGARGAVMFWADASNYISIYSAFDTDPSLYGQIRGAGNYAISAGGISISNTRVKAALAYSSGSMSFAANGTIQGTSSGTDIPASLPTLYLGKLDNGSQNGCLWIKSVSYYPGRLTDAELQQVTTL